MADTDKNPVIEMKDLELANCQRCSGMGFFRHNAQRQTTEYGNVPEEFRLADPFGGLRCGQCKGHGYIFRLRISNPKPLHQREGG